MIVEGLSVRIAQSDNSYGDDGAYVGVPLDALSCMMCVEGQEKLPLDVETCEFSIEGQLICGLWIVALVKTLIFQ